MTPDEVRQFRYDGAQPEILNPIIKVSGATVRFEGCYLNGAPLPDTRVDVFDEDSLILCFSTNKDPELLDRFSKKACVEIVDFKKLLKVVQNKYERVSFGYVRYTTGDERSHFMKSSEDDWMAEYRICVTGASEDESWLELPPGIAEWRDF